MADKELFGNSEQLDDTISRQAAIDALKMDISIIPFAKAREYVRAAIETIYNRLEELPRVQPKTHEERTETHACDCISRQAAIDAMIKLQTEDIEAYGASIPEGFDGDRAVAALKELPSAQPGWSEQYKNKQSNCKKMLLPEPWKGEEHGTSRTVLPKKSLR